MRFQLVELHARVQGRTNLARLSARGIGSQGGARTDSDTSKASLRSAHDLRRASRQLACWLPSTHWVLCSSDKVAWRSD